MAQTPSNPFSLLNIAYVAAHNSLVLAHSIKTTSAPRAFRPFPLYCLVSDFHYPVYSSHASNSSSSPPLLPKKSSSVEVGKGCIIMGFFELQGAVKPKIGVLCMSHRGRHSVLIPLGRPKGLHEIDYAEKKECYCSTNGHCSISVSKNTSDTGLRKRRATYQLGGTHAQRWRGHPQLRHLCSMHGPAQLQG